MQFTSVHESHFVSAISPSSSKLSRRAAILQEQNFHFPTSFIFGGKNLRLFLPPRSVFASVALCVSRRCFFQATPVFPEVPEGCRKIVSSTSSYDDDDLWTVSVEPDEQRNNPDTLSKERSVASFSYSGPECLSKNDFEVYEDGWPSWPSV